jgi:hypothetical protein
LVEKPDLDLPRMFAAARLTPSVNTRVLRSLIEPNSSRWRSYADHDWFKAHEEWAEAVLEELNPRVEPLKTRSAVVGL